MSRTRQCPECGHQHSAALGGICIGCPCLQGGWATTEPDRDDHAYWASVCICGMAEQERTGHYPEHDSWCEVPSPLDEDEADA